MFTRLQRLVIDGCCLWLLGGGAPLQALAGLQSLSVRLPSTASWELCECIARCRPLTELELFNVPAGDSAEVLQPLEHLTSLRRLVLRAEVSRVYCLERSRVWAARACSGAARRSASQPHCSSQPDVKRR